MVTKNESLMTRESARKDLSVTLANSEDSWLFWIYSDDDKVIWH